MTLNRMLDSADMRAAVARVDPATLARARRAAAADGARDFAGRPASASDQRRAP